MSGKFFEHHSKSFVFRTASLSANNSNVIQKKTVVRKPIKGGFPLSRKFYVRTDVNLAGFAYVNKIRSDV